MGAIRAWWDARQECRKLLMDERQAYGRWMRAYYAYQDMAIVFKDDPGAWWESGPVTKAMNEATGLMGEYLELRDRVTRMNRLQHIDS